MEQKPYITHEELVEVIREKVNQVGGKKLFSESFNINLTSLNYILSGSRKVTFSLALAMGYRIKLVYFKREDNGK